MAKTGQIQKVVNGEIADADVVNQIVENAGNEGGSIPYDETTHERDSLGNEEIGSTNYPFGSLNLNENAYFNEIDTISPSVAASVQIKNLRRFLSLKDCPTDYGGYGGSVVRVKPEENGLEFTSSLGSDLYTSSGSFTAPAAVTEVYVSLCGGGGGGSGGGNSEVSRARGGGGGSSIFRVRCTVVPGNSYTVTVGAGGTAGGNRGDGGDGGSSSFIGVETITAVGGNGGEWDPDDGVGGVASTPSLVGGNASSNTGGTIGRISFSGGNGASSASGGGGGASMFGKGANAGAAATQFGGGGGSSTSGSETPGFAGYKGFILIEWF